EKAIRGLLDMKGYLDETVKRQEKQLSAGKQTLASLEEAFAWHTSQIESLTKARDYLDGEIDQLRKSMDSEREALNWRSVQVEDLERVVASKDEAMAWLAVQVRDRENTIAAKDQALEWRGSQVESLELQLESAKDHMENIDRERMKAELEK